jgi:hypothetical protein
MCSVNISTVTYLYAVYSAIRINILNTKFYVLPQKQELLTWTLVYERDVVQL